MASIRDEIRHILENNLHLEFKDHEAVHRMDLKEAKVKIIDPQIENVIDLILDLLKDKNL